MARHSYFTVKGKPFYSIGIQSHNSSSYIPANMQPTWNAAKALHVNTVATPIPWEMFEPEEGKFDPKYVTDIIDGARANGLHLALTWFGTWKNGTMEYVPQWVKRDMVRFPRVLMKDGSVTHNLSQHAPANLEADKRAFCRFMEVLRDYDAEENTVIAVQVQNEAGLLSATRRDFSEYGNRAFTGDVPAYLIQYGEEHPCSILGKAWQKNGAKKSGSWSEVFGSRGAEYLTAWSIARYIDEMAAAGREIYDTFLYLNVWGDGGSRGSGRGLAGIDWPAGCAVSGNLDVYFATLKNIDAVAPDNYQPELTRYMEMLETYSRPEIGYPLYVPESARIPFNAGMIMEGVGNYGAIGYHVFGGESLLNDTQNGFTEEGEIMMHTFVMLSRVESILTDYVGTDRLHGILRRGNEPHCLIKDLPGGWKAYISFTGTMDNYQRMDYRHKDARNDEVSGNGGEPCRGLLFQESDDVFYVVGHKFRIFFLQEDNVDGSISAKTASPVTFPTNAEYLSVTEGHFDANGKYIVDVYRTGDENRHGQFAQWDCGVLRIELLPLA